MDTFIPFMLSIALFILSLNFSQFYIAYLTLETGFEVNSFHQHGVELTECGIIRVSYFAVIFPQSIFQINPLQGNCYLSKPLIFQQPCQNRADDSQKKREFLCHTHSTTCDIYSNLAVKAQTRIFFKN